MLSSDRHRCRYPARRRLSEACCRPAGAKPAPTNTPAWRTVIRSRSRLALSENVSCAELLASLPPEQLAAFLKRTSDRELEAIEHDWGWWGRPNQQAPKGDWRISRCSRSKLV